MGSSRLFASPARSVSGSPVKISRIASGSLNIASGGRAGTRSVNGVP